MRRASLLDAVVGPLVFTVFNFLYGPTVAVMAGLGSAAIVVAWRTFRRGALTLALSGVGGTVLASLLVAVTGQANDYFLPGIVSGVFTTVALLVSLLVGYPLVAVISSAMRRWPLQWFRHPRVKSACTLTTWIWLVFFAARTGYQLVLYRSESIELLAAVRILTGWPALVVLLATTYVVGRRKLVALGGPSVDEWSAGAQPPWQGQTHGF